MVEWDAIEDRLEDTSDGLSWDHVLPIIASIFVRELLVSRLRPKLRDALLLKPLSLQWQNVGSVRPSGREISHALHQDLAEALSMQEAYAGEMSLTKKAHRERFGKLDVRQHDFIRVGSAYFTPVLAPHFLEPALENAFDELISQLESTWLDGDISRTLLTQATADVDVFLVRLARVRSARYPGARLLAVVQLVSKLSKFLEEQGEVAAKEGCDLQRRNAELWEFTSAASVPALRRALEMHPTRLLANLTHLAAEASPHAEQILARLQAELRPLMQEMGWTWEEDVLHHVRRLWKITPNTQHTGVASTLGDQSLVQVLEPTPPSDPQPELWNLDVSHLERSILILTLKPALQRTLGIGTLGSRWKKLVTSLSPNTVDDSHEGYDSHESVSDGHDHFKHGAHATLLKNSLASGKLHFTEAELAVLGTNQLPPNLVIQAGPGQFQLAPLHVATHQALDRFIQQASQQPETHMLKRAVSDVDAFVEAASHKAGELSRSLAILQLHVKADQLASKKPEIEDNLQDFVQRIVRGPHRGLLRVLRMSAEDMANEASAGAGTEGDLASHQLNPESLKPLLYQLMVDMMWTWEEEAVPILQHPLNQNLLRHLVLTHGASQPPHAAEEVEAAERGVLLACIRLSAARELELDKAHSLTPEGSMQLNLVLRQFDDMPKDDLKKAIASVAEFDRLLHTATRCAFRMRSSGELHPDPAHNMQT